MGSKPHRSPIKTYSTKMHGLSLRVFTDFIPSRKNIYYNIDLKWQTHNNAPFYTKKKMNRNELIQKPIHTRPPQNRSSGLFFIMYESSFSQNVIRIARSKCRLVRDRFNTFTAQRATFASSFISSYRKWNAQTENRTHC